MAGVPHHSIDHHFEKRFCRQAIVWQSRNKWKKPPRKKGLIRRDIVRYLSRPERFLKKTSWMPAEPNYLLAIIFWRRKLPG